MDRDTLVELIPHYLAMLFLVFVVLGGLETAFGDLEFWAEFAIVAVVVVLYRPVVMRLGYGPSAWER